MKSLQLKSFGRLEVTNGNSLHPPANTDEVVLNVTHCALCHTDAKMWDKGHRDLRLPRVLGHEFCGTLADDPGYYIAWPGVSCGTCNHCTRGDENLCPSMRIIGFHRDGGLAQQVLVPQTCLLRVPDGLRPDLAVMAEPLGCTLNALHQAGVQKGERVLIAGAGPVGLMMSLAARALGAMPTVVEKSSTRTHKIKPFCQKTVLEIETTAPHDTFHVAVNAASTLDAFVDGIAKVATGGRLCFFSGLRGNDMLPTSILNEVHYRQLTMVGAYGCTRKNMKEALELLALHSDVLELLVEGFVGMEGVEEMLPAILRGELLKIVVHIRPQPPG